MTRTLLSLALACTVSVIALPVMADSTAKTSSASKSAPAGATAQSRDKALLAFQHDLVSVLAPRADALPLLAAALIARPLNDLPKFNNFHGLLERAAQADGAAPIANAINWTRLADCNANACPNTAALEQLTSQAPDNAAVWLLKLDEDTRNAKQDAARDDLAKAANAKLYDDYAGTSLKALAGSIGVLPPAADTFSGDNAGGAAGVQAVLVYGLASAQPQPVLSVTAKLCSDAASNASIKTDCLKLGKILEWGSSPLGRSLGLHLREVLADDPAQQADAKQARLSLVWQVQNFSQLLGRAQTDAAIAQHLVSIARHGGTEMSVLLTALRDNNIPTEAPADWTPQGPAPAQG